MNECVKYFSCLRFAAPNQGQGQMKNIYGDAEEESDEDIEEIDDEQAESLEPYESNKQYNASVKDKYDVVRGDFTDAGQFNNNTKEQLSAKANIGEEGPSDEEEFEEGVEEDMILPQDIKQTETVKTQANR